MIRDDLMKRNFWKKGRVEKLLHGKDNLVRGALLKVCHRSKVSSEKYPRQRSIPLEVLRENTNNVDDLMVDRSICSIEDMLQKMLPTPVLQVSGKVIQTIR